MSSLTITIKAWSAWAPGLSHPEQWQRWANGQTPIGGDEPPAVQVIPAMLRRRLSSLGKMALATAIPLIEDAPEVPCVLVSRHGDLKRTLGLLTDLARDEDLSPTHFSLSVHNAIGGLLSIARKDPSSITALACGFEDVSTALMEAQAILEEQTALKQQTALEQLASHKPQNDNEILCVIYDEQVPDLYSRTDDAGQTTLPHYPYAVAFLLEQTKEPSGQRYSLQLQTPLDIAVEASEPQSLTLLRWMLSSEPSPTLQLPGTRNTWQWSRSQ